MVRDGGTRGGLGAGVVPGGMRPIVQEGSTGEAYEGV